MEDFTPEMRETIKRFLLRMRGRDQAVAALTQDLNDTGDF
jgi:hypothetical protein